MQSGCWLSVFKRNMYIIENLDTKNHLFNASLARSLLLNILKKKSNAYVL